MLICSYRKKHCVFANLQGKKRSLSSRAAKIAEEVLTTPLSSVRHGTKDTKKKGGRETTFQIPSAKIDERFGFSIFVFFVSFVVVALRLFLVAAERSEAALDFWISGILPHRRRLHLSETVLKRELVRHNARGRTGRVAALWGDKYLENSDKTSATG